MKWLSKTYVWLMMAFLYMPIGVLIAYSFNQSKSRSYWTGFTLKWYKDLFQNEQILSSLRNTLIIAVVASVVATILGTAAAIGIDKFNKKLRSIIINITYIPIINPEIVSEEGEQEHTCKVCGYTEAEEIARLAEPDDPTDTQTGDNGNIMLWLALLAISAAGVMGVVVYGRRRRGSREK